MMDRINHSFLEAVREWPEEEIRKFDMAVALHCRWKSAGAVPARFRCFRGL